MKKIVEILKNKNTNETFEKVLVQEFDKDISSHKTKDLQKEILNICEKNLLKSTDFEQDELKKLKNLKEIKRINSEKNKVKIWSQKILNKKY